MKTDPPEVMRAAVARVVEMRNMVEAAVRGGFVALKVILHAEEYLTPGYYQLGPDERDIAGPGLTALRELGGSLETRVTGVSRRPCTHPTTKTAEQFLTLHLTDGRSFVPGARALDQMWEFLGTDESTYVGLRLKLLIKEHEEARAKRPQRDW